MTGLLESECSPSSTQQSGSPIQTVQVLQVPYPCSSSGSGRNQLKDGQLDLLYALALSLDDSDKSMDSESIDISNLSLTELTQHIEARHHGLLQEALPQLMKMAELVAMLHGSRDHRLAKISVCVDSLGSELLSQISKEEKSLFPLIRRLDQGEDPSSFLCASVIAPIQRKQLDHADVAELIRELQDLTNNYDCPEWGCNTYRALMDGLKQLEQNIQAYIEAEDQVLFPKAMELELQRLHHQP